MEFARVVWWTMRHPVLAYHWLLSGYAIEERFPAVLERAIVESAHRQQTELRRGMN